MNKFQTLFSNQKILNVLIFLQCPIIISYFFPLLFENTKFSNNRDDYYFSFLDYVYPYSYLVVLLLLSSLTAYLCNFKKKIPSLNANKIQKKEKYFFIFISFLSLIFNFFIATNTLIFFKQLFIQFGFISTFLVCYFISTKDKAFFYFLFLFFLIEVILTVYILGTVREVITKVYIIIFFSLLNKKLNIKFLFFLFFLFFFTLYLKTETRNKKNIIYNYNPQEYAFVNIDKNVLGEFKKEYKTEFNDHTDPKYLIELTKRLNITHLYYDFFLLNLTNNYELREQFNPYYPSMCDPVNKNCLTFSEFFKRLYNYDDNEKNTVSLYDNLFRVSKVKDILFYFKYLGKEYSFMTGSDYLKDSLFAIPIPRIFWKNKPISDKGIDLGNNYGFNSSKSGVTAWLQSSIVELYIYFKYYGLVFFVLFYSILLFIFIKLITSIKNIYNFIIICSLLKFVIDLNADGFVESLYSLYILLLFYIFPIFFFKKIYLDKNIFNKTEKKSLKKNN